MKNLLLTIALFVITHTTYASNEPIPTTAIFTIEAIDFKMSNVDMDKHSIEVIFNEANGNLEFSSQKEVSFLQVYNGLGELEYQLPIFSKEVTLDLNDFNQGQYKLNIMLENDTVVPASFSKG